MDVDDVSATLKEIGRVMKPDGVLLISLVHPSETGDALQGAHRRPHLY